jgi:hypothetical protein
LGRTVIAVSVELAETEPLGKTFVVRISVRQFFLGLGILLKIKSGFKSLS